MRAADIYLAISLSIALRVSMLVFFVWYSYRKIVEVRELFLPGAAVDAAMDPLMTLSVFNLTTLRKKLRRDLAAIALLQLAAVVYGLWTVTLARLVYRVFQIDCFRVVHAIDIEPVLLKRAAPAMQDLPMMGPTLLWMREFSDRKENFDATIAARQVL